MAEIKRTNFFQYQLLKEADFTDEQNYHISMRRLHNRHLHISGVAGGLEVSADGTGTVKISAGFGIDGKGREIVLPDDTQIDFGADEYADYKGQTVSLIAFYQEEKTDEYTESNKGVEQQFKRVTESCETRAVLNEKDEKIEIVADARSGDRVEMTVAEALNDGTALLLARVALDAQGKVGANQVDKSARRIAGSLIRRGGGLGENDLYIATDGNVGIGTTDPKCKLDVNGAANIWSGERYAVAMGFMAAGSLTIGNIKANFGGQAGWSNNSAGLLLETLANTEIAVCDRDNGLVSLMYYEGGDVHRITIGRPIGRQMSSRGDISTLALNGNVGIGTTKPLATLQVGKDGSEGSPGIRIGWGAGNDGDRLTIYNSDGYNMGLRRGERDLRIFAKSPDGDGHIHLMPNNAVAMTLLSNGNVGIGTAEPATRLTVKAAGRTIPAPTPPPTVSSFIQEGSTIVRAYSNSTFEQIKVGDVISCVISSDQRTVIRKNSETEILIDRPFNFSGAGVTLVVITKPPPVSEDMFRVEDSAGDAKFFIAGDGKVGIGTDKPTALLALRDSAELGPPVEGINGLVENQLDGWGAEQPPDGTLLIIVGFDSISKTNKTLLKKVGWTNFISPGHVDNTILLEDTGDDSSSMNSPAVYIAPTDPIPLMAVHNYVGEKVFGITASEVSITKNLSKPGGAFKIDHPLDPANKYLYHSFVESPDMKNIYDGVVVLDGKGEAWVELPEWFEALNRDFRYQLTALNASAPNIYIAQEIRDGCFKIAGGVARTKVCWQVTGIRQDAYANANRIEVEAEKPETERGRYLHPEAFGQPPGKAIGSTDSKGRGSSSSY